MSNQSKVWFSGITKHQYCFNRAQLQTDIMATLGRQDLLKFYDHYIAPNSVHRRKLAVHVVPSPLVAAEIIQEQTTSILVLTSPPITPSTPMSKDDGKRIRKLQRQQSITSKTIATPIEKLTVEPVICNLPIAKALDTSINQTESTNEIMIENIMKNEKQLMLPE
ncbi:unnamed protein product, partial [Didymodactylos carnosus]